MLKFAPPNHELAAVTGEDVDDRGRSIGLPRAFSVCHPRLSVFLFSVSKSSIFFLLQRERGGEREGGGGGTAA